MTEAKFIKAGNRLVNLNHIIDVEFISSQECTEHPITEEPCPTWWTEAAIKITTTALELSEEYTYGDGAVRSFAATSVVLTVKGNEAILLNKFFMEVSK